MLYNGGEGEPVSSFEAGRAHEQLVQQLARQNITLAELAARVAELEASYGSAGIAELRATVDALQATAAAAQAEAESVGETSAETEAAVEELAEQVAELAEQVAEEVTEEPVVEAEPEPVADVVIEEVRPVRTHAMHRRLFTRGES